MDAARSLLDALHADPADHAARLALADALEEAGREGEAEVARLHARQLMRAGSREELEWLCALLQGGVRPVVPEVVNSVGMRLALVPPGAFLMGSPEGEEGRGEDEVQHEVRVTRPFYLGVFAVTQAEYREVMGESPNWFASGGGGKEQVGGMDTGRFPVEQVSYADAVAFCERLSARAAEKRAGRSYRLPSEAEWEYSCRGGAVCYQTFHFGNAIASAQANFNGDHPYGGADMGVYLGRTIPVGSYAGNAFGLYDLHGNVWEWCHHDPYADRHDAGGLAQAPAVPRDSLPLVFRGGSWAHDGRGCRSACRGRGGPETRYNILGLRVALVPSGGRGGAEAGGGERRRRSDRRERRAQ